MVFSKDIFSEVLNFFKRLLPFWKLEKEVEYFVSTLLCIVGGIGGVVIAVWGVGVWG